ncbi:phage tail protein [Pseudomonas viridiflava]|uniref:phage tail protein n=1 Tax=Pseudomonas viridiflava TaxID=33069 RepID=UPI0018E60148|nr:phage tail protein [Pseudomonas viridiflava]MBI6684536.1 phage tail protein [Pseudomonas viridiflava]
MPYDASTHFPAVANIDWSKLVTKEMKDSEAAARELAQAKAELSARNATAAAQIARIQDRIETLGYGIEAGEATEQEEFEAASLEPVLKAWKAYKFALGKVTAQPTWHKAPIWPVAPKIPEIAAAPMMAPDSAT